MKKLFIVFFLLTFATFLFPQTGWVEVTSGSTAELQGIDWVSATVVWVSAADGSVLRSTDGGTTWTAAGNVGGGAGAYGIAAIDAQTAVVCFGPNSGPGKIWRTTNGGTNWTEVYSNASAWFNFVDNINSTTLWAQSDPVAGNWLILKSTDAGATWNPITPNVPMATGAGAFLSFYRIGSKLWFGSSSANKIFYSNNGIDGPWLFSNATVNNVGSVAFNGIDGNGLASFWSNTTQINKTTNGGQTWVTQAITGTGAFSGIDYIVGTNNAWAATATGIWRTTDNGTTWTQDVTTAAAMNWVKFYNDANVGLAVGLNGKIYKSTMAAIIPTTLTHNTGNLAVTLFNNGYIGHDYGAVGGGVVVGTYPDAMYTAGMVIGDPVTGVNGMVGSFTDGTNPVIQDNVKQYGMFGFSNNATWNQIASAGYKDDLATVPFGLMVHQESFSATNDKFVIIRYKIQNNTLTPKNNLNVGVFADWDVGATNYAKNRGGVDVDRKMVYQYLNTAPINDPNYYGIVALNGIAGGKVTSDFDFTAATLRSLLFPFFSTIDATPITVDADYRSYIGSGPFNIPVGQELLVGFAIVHGSSLADLQTNAVLAYQKGAQLVPVELTSFTASVISDKVNLKWATATEVNNHGFEIERRIVGESNWATIGFKAGSGTSTSETQYTFTDDLSLISAKQIAYRLKQIDFDGTYSYSDEVMVEYNATPTDFSVTQNYPNPFNPTTTIKFQLPADKFVSLKVFNSLGEEVKTLVSGLIKTGSHEVEFNGEGLSSGVYLYVLRVGDDEFVKTMKMILMK